MSPPADRNFDLFLHRDEDYANLNGSSCESSGELEWILFEGVERVYPKVQVIDYEGCGWIEWDTARSIQRGDLEPGYLNEGDCIEIYSFSLSQEFYSFKLEVPATGDFDLYLYHLEAGWTANATQHLNKSASAGLGVGEMIENYRPPPCWNYTSHCLTYLALIVRVAGNGTYTFSFDYYSASPTTDDQWIYWCLGIGVLGAVIVAVVVMRRLHPRLYHKE